MSPVQPVESQNYRNFLRRTATVVVAIPLTIAVIFQGGVVFIAFVCGLMALAMLEMATMLDSKQRVHLATIPILAAIGCALAVQAQAWGAVLGCMGIGAGLYSLVQRNHPLQDAWRGGLMLAYIALPSGIVLWMNTLPDGHWWVLCLFLSSFMGTDVAAYVGGRYFGKRPIFPHISPNKTLEGMLMGWLGGFLAVLVILIHLDWVSVSTFLLAGSAPILAILGDLLESFLKRRLQVKDSAVMGINPFPGHGGVLDRVDSMLTVAWLYAWYISVWVR